MLASFTKPGLIRLLVLLAIGMVTFCANSQFHSAAPLPSLAANQKPAEWDRYTIRGGEFSVLLPTTPAMSTYETKGHPLNKVRMRYLVGAYSQGVVYAVYVFKRDSSLEDFIADHSPAKRGFTRDLKLGELLGKEYVVQTADTKSVVQYFITKRFIYSFVAHGSYLENPEAGISKFFDSIRFDSSDDHIAIVNGPGVQPATDPADESAARVFAGKDTGRKAVVITKPEPSYTEAARKNQLMGTVVIRCIFTSSGAVTNLRFVSGLPDGLSENALAAAKQIRFIPAIKDGHFVSMYIQLEYNFNLY